MKTIGIIGGMSWESTVTYYQLINREINRQLGGMHSAKLNLMSLDFAEIERLQHVGDWDATADILIDAARRLELSGVDALLIATNTMHKVADQVESAVDVPLLHIATATAQVLKADKIRRVGLLGTAFTMEQHFYRQRIEAHNIEVVTPSSTDREMIHRVIYQELCLGHFNDVSREAYLAVIDRLSEQGAQGVILGCTEIGLLVRQVDTTMPLYDTSEIHARAAVDFMLT